MMGAQGTGKGTVAGILKEELNIPHISTGDIFRKNIKEGTELGKIATKDADEGKLVPDEVTNAMVKSRINESDCENGFILDGYPRNINQAYALEDVLKELGLSLDCAIELDVPYDTLLKRAIGRVSCPKCKATFNTSFKQPQIEGICDVCGEKLFHRSDDNEETFASRYKTYLENAEPLISFYESQGKLVKLDGINNTLSLLVSVIQ